MRLLDISNTVVLHYTIEIKQTKFHWTDCNKIEERDSIDIFDSFPIVCFDNVGKHGNNSSNQVSIT